MWWRWLCDMKACPIVRLTRTKGNGARLKYLCLKVLIVNLVWTILCSDLVKPAVLFLLSCTLKVFEKDTGINDKEIFVKSKN